MKNKVFVYCSHKDNMCIHCTNMKRKFYNLSFESWCWQYTNKVCWNTKLQTWQSYLHTLRNILHTKLSYRHLRARRVLSQHKVYGDSALLVLNGTSLDSDIAPFWHSTDDMLLLWEYSYILAHVINHYRTYTFRIFKCFRLIFFCTTEFALMANTKFWTWLMPASPTEH